MNKSKTFIIISLTLFVIAVIATATITKSNNILESSTYWKNVEVVNTAMNNSVSIDDKTVFTLIEDTINNGKKLQFSNLPQCVPEIGALITGSDGTVTVLSCIEVDGKQVIELHTGDEVIYLSSSKELTDTLKNIYFG